MNSYESFLQIRSNINEATAVHWSDLDILQKQNNAQRRLGLEISMVDGDWLLVSEDLTPVASKITLPNKCAKPVYIEEKASGNEVFFGSSVRNRRRTRSTLPLSNATSYLDAYMKDNFIVVNKDGYTTEVTLWYQKKVTNLFHGTAASGTTSTSLIFDSDMYPVQEDDYYNGVLLDIVSGTGAGKRLTISDYDAATYKATVDQTVGTDTIFGTISVLPEEAYDIITLLATLELLAKPSSTIDPKYFEHFASIYKDAKKGFDEWISTRVNTNRRLGISY